MPTKTESDYAGYLLSHLSHCAPGQCIYIGANAGECGKDGAVLAQPSTYPAWYSNLCTLGESYAAIRRNLEAIAQGKERTTQGYRRVLKAVHTVMLYGCSDSATPPDFAYMCVSGCDEESVLAAMDYYGCLCDEPEVSAPVRNLYADLPSTLLAVMPNLEPYAEVVLGVGCNVWVKATDKVAEQALAQAGFKYAPSLNAWHAKTERAHALPVKSAPQGPRSVAWRPYDRTPITF